MTLPAPELGLVLSYSYLWAHEYHTGAEEGRKTRPCAIVAARQMIEGHEIVSVVPVTHTAPKDPGDAVEIPAQLKAYLGLDILPSWIVVTEYNSFVWPGPDLRPVPGADMTRFDYGLLPPRFFTHLRNRIVQVRTRLQLTQVTRTE